MSRGLLESVLIVGLLSSGSARAEPMSLQDSRPRWVLVAFEASPPNRPGQLDAQYAPALPAWFEPGAPDRLRVTVARGVVERYLIADLDPKPGSFEDFVWVFDATSGHVLSAQMAGTIRRNLDWGWFTSMVETDIRVDLDTRGPAGFKRPRRMLGQLLFDYCNDPEHGRCTEVMAVPYDPESGYVNAVGKLDVRTHGLRVETFAPLGEAVFSEMPRTVTPALHAASARAAP